MPATVKGLDEIIARLREIGSNLTEASDQALEAAGKTLLDAARPLAPIGPPKKAPRRIIHRKKIGKGGDGLQHPGALRNSGFVEQVQPLRWRVGFRTPYAHRQHEETSWHHPQGGQAKYLTGPFMTQRQALIDQIAETLRAKLTE